MPSIDTTGKRGGWLLLCSRDHAWRRVDAENRAYTPRYEQRVIRPLTTADIQRQVTRMRVKTIKNSIEIVVGSFAIPLVRFDANIELVGGAVLISQRGWVGRTIHTSENGELTAACRTPMSLPKKAKL